MSDGVQKPTVVTPLSVQQAVPLLRDAWRVRFGDDVDGKILRLLVSLWDLETGAGRSQLNHNWGNQIATRPEQNFYVADDSGNSRRFRHYDTFEEGALSFVSQLTSTTRPQWKAGLLTGDPVEFVRALKGLNGGPEYFEAPFERYLGTFRGRWERYPELGDGAVPPAEGQGALVLGAIIGGLWLLRRVL